MSTSTTLNDKQLEAVQATEGPLLIIAGAGSGKTKVLTERLAYIVKQGLASPEQILLVTFTNKAAAEIRERALQRLQKEAPGYQAFSLPWLGTFHSIAVKILRRDSAKIGINNNFSICDADDQISLIKQVCKELSISNKDFNPRALLAGISGAKQNLLTPENYKQAAQGYFQETVAVVYQLYQKTLMESSSLDFDDLLNYTVFLLQQSLEVKQKYQELFRYVMVDEYQDTNYAQYLLLKELSGKYNNVCVVGDDDQSIYSWRGATIRNILEFEKDFQQVKIIKLEQNYRSTQKILAAGNSVVKSISARKAKTLWTNNPLGENLTVYSALDEREEALWVAEQIDKLTTQTPERVDPEEIAILYRMNSQSRQLEEAFLKANIAYRIVGNVRFYERKEIKDALAYLRLIYNPDDSISLLRIINVPSRKIGAKTIKELLMKARALHLSPIDYLQENRGELKPGLKQFSELVTKLQAYTHEHNIVDLIRYTLEESGYLKLLDDGSEDSRQRQSNLQELLNVASKYQELSPQASLQAFLEEVALVENQAEEKGVGEARVTLMTVHSAKGLEFRYVFVVGVEEGIFPHSRSFTNPNELDEERRLAYVAITRAKEKVFLSFAGNRSLYGSRMPSIPSRFLAEIEPALLDYESFQGALRGYDDYRGFDSEISAFNRNLGHPGTSSSQAHFQAQSGDQVFHQQFGKGKIVSINEETVVIDFERYGKKELATEYAQLQRL